MNNVYILQDGEHYSSCLICSGVIRLSGQWSTKEDNLNQVIETTAEQSMRYIKKFEEKQELGIVVLAGSVTSEYVKTVHGYTIKQFTINIGNREKAADCMVTALSVENCPDEKSFKLVYRPVEMGRKQFLQLTDYGYWFQRWKKDNAQ